MVLHDFQQLDFILKANLIDKGFLLDAVVAEVVADIQDKNRKFIQVLKVQPGNRKNVQVGLSSGFLQSEGSSGWACSLARYLRLLWTSHASCFRWSCSRYSRGTLCSSSRPRCSNRCMQRCRKHANTDQLRQHSQRNTSNMLKLTLHNDLHHANANSMYTCVPVLHLCCACTTPV